MKYCSFTQSLGRPVLRSAGIIGTLFLTVFAFLNPASAGDLKNPSAKDLEGITIRSPWFPSGPVTLRNGEYRGPAAPGSAAEIVIRLTDQCAFGAVNGSDTAAIVLATDPGGSGTFYDLALLFMKSGEWVYSDAARLGDRVKIRSVGINNNEILVKMTEHGPGDAMCCPTRNVTRRFAVQADRLVAMQGARAGLYDSGIIGPVWQWVKTQYSNDTAITRPAETTGYTLLLNPDGTIKVRGDCNAGGGTFILNDSKFSITITYTTMAACPDGSLENPYFFDLNRTSGFLLKDSSLFLDLKLDSGTMEFRKKEQKTK